MATIWTQTARRRTPFLAVWVNTNSKSLSRDMIVMVQPMITSTSLMTSTVTKVRMSTMKTVISVKLALLSKRATVYSTLMTSMFQKLKVRRSTTHMIRGLKFKIRSSNFSRSSLRQSLKSCRQNKSCSVVSNREDWCVKKWRQWIKTSTRYSKRTSSSTRTTCSFKSNFKTRWTFSNRHFWRRTRPLKNCRTTTTFCRRETTSFKWMSKSWS